MERRIGASRSGAIAVTDNGPRKVSGRSSLELDATKKIMVLKVFLPSHTLYVQNFCI